MKKSILALGPSYSVHTFKWLYPLKENYQITLFSFHAPEQVHAIELTSHIEIIELPRLTKTKFDYFYMPLFLMNLIFKRNYSLVISQYASSYGLLGALFTPFKRKLLIFWGSDYYRYQNSIVMSSGIRFIAKLYDHVIVPSTAMKKELFNEKKMDFKVSAFQYGIPWKKYNSLLPLKNKSSEITKYLSIRKWEELYNIHLIIEAFLQYLNKQPQDELHLTINSNSIYADKLKEKIKNRPQIKTYDTLDAENLYQLIGSSNIIISIPKSDGMPLSVLEAVSSGCFPILSNLPANVEILKHCEGLLVEENSIDSMVNSMIQAKNLLSESLPENNSIKIRQIADNEIADQKILQLVNRLIGKINE